MIYALRHPALLLGLALGFLVGIVARVWVQRRIAGGRRGGLRVAGARRPAWRPRDGWAAYLDPYGTVAAVLSGVGWGARVPGGRSRWADVNQLIAALVVHGVLAAAGLALFRAASGAPLSSLHGLLISDVLRSQNIGGGSFTELVTIGFACINLACALLALLPVPPLELGVILWSRLPRSPSARRMAYHLLEEAWGVAIVLVLLLLGFGQRPPLLVLLDAVAKPIFNAL